MIIQDGLIFEERVGCKPPVAADAGKVSMRSISNSRPSEPDRWGGRPLGGRRIETPAQHD